MTPLERATRARQLLADEVLRDALSDIRMSLVSQLESVPIGDIDTQHEIALTMQLLKRLRTQLEMYGQEVTIEQNKRKQESFIQRVRAGIQA